MKKIFSLLAAVCVTLSAAADEGMWLLPYLQKMNIRNMKERGLQTLRRGDLQREQVVAQGCRRHFRRRMYR